MADPVNEFRVNESFSEKVLGITVFNGRVVVAREDGVFMQDEDGMFRRVEPHSGPMDKMDEVMAAWRDVMPC